MVIRICRDTRCHLNATPMFARQKSSPDKRPIRYGSALPARREFCSPKSRASRADRREAVDHPKPWLRYVEADKVDDKTLNVDDMPVRNSAKENLGNVDGFIVDAESGRPYYVVVDAGGWFKSKQFLVPIGQVQVDDDR